MASPRTVALRETTQGKPAYLNRARKPKETTPGEYAGLLAQYVTQGRRQRRARQSAARVHNDQSRGFERTIPASGPGRRRAKALRNARAVAASAFPEAHPEA